MKNYLSIILIIMLMSVYVPNVRCEIGKLQPFQEVTSIEVKSSWKTLTDMATIEMPKNIKVREGQTLIDLNNVIRKGDSVKISGGYNGVSKVEFQGFVSYVSKNVPLSIECEDYMYLLKLDTHSFTLKNPTLETVVNRLLNGDRLKVKRKEGFDFTTQVTKTEPIFNEFSVRNLTAAQVLQQITDNFPLMAYFRHDSEGVNKPVLVVGYPYDEKPNAKKPILRFGSNVPQSGWNLTYQNAEDVKVKIKAISNLKTGKKLIVEVGDMDGETRTRNYPEVTKSQLTDFANDELKHFKRDGFTGSVMAFGIPFVKHGDVVSVDDPVYTKESGNYYVDATTWTFDHSPSIRRSIIIGLKG